MLNFLSTILAIIGFQSGYFWQLLFIANAVCRYNCNRLRILLWLSMVSIVLNYVIATNELTRSANFLFLSQASICGFSFVYNIYRRNWNRDYLFFWIEPILGSIFFLYFFNRVLLMQNVKTFFIVYLSLQAFVALWHILGFKIYVRDSKVVFALLPQTPLNEILDLMYLKFHRRNAKLSGLEKKKKKLTQILSQDEFNGKYIDLWKNKKKISDFVENDG